MSVMYVRNKSTGQFEPIPSISGQTPYIGENNHWWIGETDTGISAQGIMPTVNGKTADAEGNIEIDVGVKTINQKTPDANGDIGFYDIAYIGSNPITNIENDTVASWVALGSGYAWYNTAGCITNQPSTYGFLVSHYVNKNVFQIWKTHLTGEMYCRSGNKDGWGMQWKKLLSESDTAASANKLATSRTIRTNLASTSTASFDGSNNITPGVTGILPITNGGTGNTTGTAQNANKLGGKDPAYFLQPRNLLDNSDFRNPINQRGETAYTTYASKYTIDRWKTYGTITINNGYVSFENTSADNATIYLYQYLPLGTIKAGTTYTAVCMLSDGTICAGKGTATDGAWYTVYTHADGWNMRIRANADGSDQFIFGTYKTGMTIDIVWCALYEGDFSANVPEYQYKGYANELLECQRYYYQANSYTCFTGYKSTSPYFFITLPTRMRITPTIATTEIAIRGSTDGEGTSETVSIADIDYDGAFGNAIRVSLTGDTKSNHQPLVVITRGLKIFAEFQEELNV